jgi:hypothetical protein
MSKASCFFKSVFCDDCNSVYVEEVVAADCSSTMTSTDQANSVSKVQVFPNPFENDIYLNGLIGNEIFTLFNSFGSILFLGNTISNADLAQLASGMYFLKIEQDSNSQIIKLIKR